MQPQQTQTPSLGQLRPFMAKRALFLALFYAAETVMFGIMIIETQAEAWRLVATSGGVSFIISILLLVAAF